MDFDFDIGRAWQEDRHIRRDKLKLEKRAGVYRFPRRPYLRDMDPQKFKVKYYLQSK